MREISLTIVVNTTTIVIITTLIIFLLATSSHVKDHPNRYPLFTRIKLKIKRASLTMFLGDFFSFLKHLIFTASRASFAAFLLGIFVAWVYGHYTLSNYSLSESSKDKYDLLVDLTLVSLAMMAVIWYALKRIIDVQVDALNHENRIFTEAHALKNGGVSAYFTYVFYSYSDRNNDELKQYFVERAVTDTRKALSLTQSTSHNDTNELLRLICMNNLAYF